ADPDGLGNDGEVDRLDSALNKAAWRVEQQVLKERPIKMHEELSLQEIGQQTPFGEDSTIGTVAPQCRKRACDRRVQRRVVLTGGDPRQDLVERAARELELMRRALGYVVRTGLDCRSVRLHVPKGELLQGVGVAQERLHRDRGLLVLHALLA